MRSNPGQEEETPTQRDIGTVQRGDLLLLGHRPICPAPHVDKTSQGGNEGLNAEDEEVHGDQWVV